jgi:hypothetical protein
LPFYLLLLSDTFFVSPLILDFFVLLLSFLYYSAFSLSPPSEDSLEPGGYSWCNSLEFWTRTGLDRGYTAPGFVFRQGPFHTRTSAPSTTSKRKKKSAPSPVTSHQSPVTSRQAYSSPGFPSPTPPLSHSLWLPPSWSRFPQACPYPRSWRRPWFSCCTIIRSHSTRLSGWTHFSFRTRP